MFKNTFLRIFKRDAKKSKIYPIHELKSQNYFQILTRTIEGLGQHGMVGTSDQSLMNLHDALRIELQKVLFLTFIFIH